MSEVVKTGLIGHPVLQSKSPLIHGHWMKQLGISGTYSAVDLPCEGLEDGVKNLIAQGYRGFNVTVPHKIAMLEICDHVDELAQIVGAVNTVSIKDGKLYGTNTDVFGFTQNIRETYPDFDFTRGAALVLGAGGAARAVVQGLIDSGVPQVRIANRTRKNADLLLAHASAPEKIEIIEWARRENRDVLGDINLVVNTTSLGMTGKGVLEMDLAALPVSAVVNDIVYAPLMTQLLNDAKMRGSRVVTGIGMLLHQARPAFELWHGVRPDVDVALEKLVLA